MPAVILSRMQAQTLMPLLYGLMAVFLLIAVAALVAGLRRGHASADVGRIHLDPDRSRLAPR